MSEPAEKRDMTPPANPSDVNPPAAQPENHDTQQTSSGQGQTARLGSSGNADLVHSELKEELVVDLCEPELVGVSRDQDTGEIGSYELYPDTNGSPTCVWKTLSTTDAPKSNAPAPAVKISTRAC